MRTAGQCRSGGGDYTHVSASAGINYLWHNRRVAFPWTRFTDADFHQQRVVSSHNLTLLMRIIHAFPLETISK